MTPDVPVLSEEGAHTPYATRRNWPQLWLVDPLDGTKEFIRRNGEFTVNIALVERGRVVWGVVHAPVEMDCLLCHDPHNSTAPAGLSKPQAELCASCHKLESDVLVEAHQGYDLGGSDCASCHSPHASSEEGLLRRTFRSTCAAETGQEILACDSVQCRNVCHRHGRREWIGEHQGGTPQRIGDTVEWTRRGWADRG